ncbi:hypothetical protein H6G00_07070 [Leptolyngbya sp. FACHB-541]|uniref:hypothetical protein n=1 Tax=Leptolyngbya sp. FACHB-541 TaxID=2692810 RepID=UPI001686E203|nr:hypothetical protein [Leptolyngbya sp. FACHB-541]MBD1996376.1 hypothetical protein [Leptolyngbya sp. FACHB-541]
MLFRHVSVSLSLAALALVSNALVAQANTVDSASVDVVSEQPASEVEAVETQPGLAIAPVQPEQTVTADSESLTAPDVTALDVTALDVTTEAQVQLADIQELPVITATPETEQANSTAAPAESVTVAEEYVEDSTASTSAAALTEQPEMVDGQTVEEQETSVEPAAEQVAQTVTPGRSTRSGPSYLGVGGNIGLGDGDTALGEGSFAVFSKIGLTSFLSVRPAVLFSDDPTILVPVTFDFIPGVTDVTEDVSGELGLRVSPYVGGGVAISTGDDGSVDFLLSGGVDVPITSRITATAAVNATVFDNPAVGLMLGVGYNFGAF